MKTTARPAVKTRRKHHARLYEVLRVVRRLAEMTDLKSLLDLILLSAKKTMRAEASSLMLLDHASNELFFQEIRGGDEDIKEVRLKVGQGVAGRVAETGKPMIVNDVSKCPYFFPGADRRTGYVTRQILCVPLKARKTVIGVLQVLNRTTRERFNREDLLLFSNFAAHAAVAIENARLYNLAAYDSLTQIFSRGHFRDWLESEVSRVARYGRPLTLMLLDVDGFKQINDRLGHGAGDALLAGLARILRESLRASDVAARYGGDELIAALTETPLEKARIVAERLRAEVAARRFFFNGESFGVTISVGLAAFQPAASETPSTLIERADRALYESKRTRNAVSSAPFSGANPPAGEDPPRS